MKLPRIAWLRWAGPEEGIDRLKVVGARNNEDAKRVVTTEDILKKTLESISKEVDLVTYDNFTYIEFDQFHWEDEEGIPEVDRWDVIIIGPEDQLFWQLVSGALGDAELEFEYVFKSRAPQIQKSGLVHELHSWCAANPADARNFLEWAGRTWPLDNIYVEKVIRPELLSLIEAAEIADSIPYTVVTTREGGHGKGL